MTRHAMVDIDAGDLRALWNAGEALMRQGTEDLSVSMLAMALRFSAESGIKLSDPAGKAARVSDWFDDE